MGHLRMPLGGTRPGSVRPIACKHEVATSRGAGAVVALAQFAAQLLKTNESLGVSKLSTTILLKVRSRLDHRMSGSPSSKSSSAVWRLRSAISSARSMGG